MVAKALYIITYDIARTDRRNQVAKLLELYGTRVNLSVFECMLTDRQLSNLLSQIEKVINLKKDTVCTYKVCTICYTQSKYLGRPPDLPREKIIIT